MKLLTEYTKNKYTFQLIERDGDFAIFRGYSKDHSRPNWEVIKIQHHDGRDAFGKHYDPTEFPPSDAQWGEKGWTAENEEHAREILKRKKNQSHTPRWRKLEPEIAPDSFG